MSHIELTDETTDHFGITLYRIRATVNLPMHGVKAGDLGGFVENLNNVSDNAWISGTARVYNDARVYGTARVYGNARIAKMEHCLTLGPIGSENVTVSLFRTDNGHTLQVGCWTGTIDRLAAKVHRRSIGWVAPEATKLRWITEYEALEMLCRARVSGWTIDEN